jgi:4-amino-4-deoxy-L-arabinose transferase-like glycosyltransferase
MIDEKQTRRIVWPLFIIFCLIWFYALGARTLVPTDEGRYAEMAREMAATGDWITPRLNAIKYFEKPPLQIWMTALAFKLFGLGEWQARLWTGLCGLFGIALTAYTGRTLFNPRVGLTAGLVLASSFLWASLGHVNTLDMGLAGMMTLALCSLLLGQRNEAGLAEQRRWMLLCWAGMALSVMSKGLIGLVLPGAVLVLYTVIARDWAIWKRLHAGLGLLVFFALTTPWFVLVSLQNPEFPQFFFIHEHFQRFTSKIHHREGPWHYFIPILLLGILPWLTVLAQGLWQGMRREAEGFQPKMLLLVWAVFIFFFFSISSSKLPSYILPIFPALALLIALYLDHAGRKTWLVAAGFMMLLGAIGLAIVPEIEGWTTDALDLEHYRAAQPWALAATLVLLACGAAALWSLRQGRQNPGLRAPLMLAIGGFLAGQLTLLATEPYGRYRSGLPMVPLIKVELTPQTPIYSVGLYDQTLPFYLQRTMTLVEHADELAFGLQQEPQLWLPTMEAFLVKWAEGSKAIAITRPEIYDVLQQRGVAMRVVARDSRRVVLANDLKQDK